MFLTESLLINFLISRFSLSYWDISDLLGIQSNYFDYYSSIVLLRLKYFDLIKFPK